MPWAAAHHDRCKWARRSDGPPYLVNNGRGRAHPSGFPGGPPLQSYAVAKPSCSAGARPAATRHRSTARLRAIATTIFFRRAGPRGAGKLSRGGGLQLVGKNGQLGIDRQQNALPAGQLRAEVVGQIQLGKGPLLPPLRGNG